MLTKWNQKLTFTPTVHVYPKCVSLLYTFESILGTKWPTLWPINTKSPWIMSSNTLLIYCTKGPNGPLKQTLQKLREHCEFKLYLTTNEMIDIHPITDLSPWQDEVHPVVLLWKKHQSACWPVLYSQVYMCTHTFKIHDTNQLSKSDTTFKKHSIPFQMHLILGSSTVVKTPNCWFQCKMLYVTTWAPEVELSQVANTCVNMLNFGAHYCKYSVILHWN